LLEEKVELPAFIIAGMNRRQMVRVLGLGAIIAVPLVTTIVRRRRHRLPRNFHRDRHAAPVPSAQVPFVTVLAQVVLQLVYVPSAGLTALIFRGRD